jgi:hypothetical protein
MSAPAKNRISIKIFIGFRLSLDLKTQLNRSIEWKQAAIVHDEEEFLEFIRFDETEYMGRYLKHPILTLKEIKDHAADIRKKLKIYVPEFDMDNLQINLFPQVFVS